MTTSFLPGQDVSRSLHEVAHPAAALSAADLMAVLLARHLRYDFADPEAAGNDHLVFGQGQAAPLYYAMLRAAGAISEQELLSYRQLHSRLEGHPTPRLPWVDVAAGSLGQGLPVGTGMALAGKCLDKLPYRVWVLYGAAELAEGSTWEAAEQAAGSGLGNLTLIVDLGQPGQSRPGRDAAAYAARFRAFGWHAQQVDGHDVEAVDLALGAAAAHPDAPSVILARTQAGPARLTVVDGGAAGDQAAARRPGPAAAGQPGGPRAIRVKVAPPLPLPDARRSRPVIPWSEDRWSDDQWSEEWWEAVSWSGDPWSEDPWSELSRPGTPGSVRWLPPAFEPGSMESTRTGFGEALAALGSARPDLAVLDAAASGATRTSYFARAHPDRFFECYAAEQQMLAAAVGIQVRGWVPFATTFAASFARAYDYIRMAAVSRASIRLVGSHAGISAGEQGPAQMALEDVAAMRAVYGSTVLCPCDANQAAWLTGAMADLPGVSYLRTGRDQLPVIYQARERFAIGGSRVLRSSPDDQVTLVAAGVTVHEALAAADLLAEDGITARVIDAYSVKPLDAATVRAAARDTGRIVTVEDHWPEGGLGDAVLGVLAADTARAGGGQPLPVVRKLAVRAMPGSAAPAEQVQLAGIDMASIATAAAELVGADLA
jgi:transketolase